MAITNGYATLAEFKLYKKITTTDTDRDSVIEDIIEGASRDIDREVGRTFYARTETRYFDVPIDNSRLLRVDDDLLAITTLTNGDSNTIAATEYNLVPKNVAPYYGIRLKSGSAYYWNMDSSGNTEDVISIAGTWGWSSTAPNDIRQLCLAMSLNDYKKRFGEGQQSATITAAGVVLSSPGMIKELAEKARRYKRRT